MSKGSKDKGSRFERWLKADLTEFTGVQFERVIGSGGVSAKGDIYPAYESLRFIIEAKHVEAWDHSQLVSAKGPISKWWPKVCKEASDAERFPLLIFKKNYNEILAATCKEGFKVLFGRNRPEILIINERFGEAIYIFPYEDIKSRSTKERIVG